MQTVTLADALHTAEVDREGRCFPGTGILRNRDSIYVTLVVFTGDCISIIHGGSMFKIARSEW